MYKDYRFNVVGVDSINSYVITAYHGVDRLGSINIPATMGSAAAWIAIIAWMKTLYVR